MFSFLDLAAIFLSLSALFEWLSRKFIPLPSTIGLLLMSVATSLVLVTVDMAFPGQHLFEPLTDAMRQIDFSSVVMNGMLGFLLFAGALHVDLDKLRDRALQVAVLAGLATVISTILVGFAIWETARLIGAPLSLAWALVFGAVISPTDPVAVLNTLKNVRVPPHLEIEMQGESLFNDGIGIVLFTVLLRFATNDTGASIGAAEIFELIVLEAGGGLLLGLATGYLAYRAMHLIDDYATEVLISLALVTTTYALAERIHVSGPLSVVAAGLLIGDRGPRYAMSERTQTYLFGLWTLIDEILNSVLFLLIGLEVLVLRFEPLSLAIAATAVPIVLIARFCAVGLPPLAFAWTREVTMKAVPFLTWGGVRGGISVALALSVPESPARPVILAATYVVVLFSILVQGSTLNIVARRTLKLPSPRTADP